MKHFEKGLNGKSLLWRSHLLSELFATGETLDMEPMIDPALDVDKTPFNIVPDREVSWQWDDWENAQLKLIYGHNGESEPLKHYNTHDESIIYFANLRKAVTYELTLYSPKQGTNAVKFNLTADAFAASVEWMTAGDDLIVRIVDNIRIDGFRVETWRSSGGDLLRDESCFFENGRSEIVLRFRDPQTSLYKQRFVTVSKQIGDGWKLLRYGAMGIHGVFSGAQGVTAERLKRLQQLIEGEIPTPVRESEPPDWLANWTNFSRRRFESLKALAEKTLQASASALERYLRNYPTGLVRYLILQRLGCQWIQKNPSQYITRLNQDDFLTALKICAPDFKDLLDNLPKEPAKRVWIIKNLSHLSLAEAVRRAGKNDFSALRRALHLLDVRDAAVRERDKIFGE